MRLVARVMIPLQREHSGIRFHLYSANAGEVTVDPCIGAVSEEYEGMLNTMS